MNKQARNYLPTSGTLPDPIQTPHPKPLPHAALLNICGGAYACKARGPAHGQDLTPTPTPTPTPSLTLTPTLTLTLTQVKTVTETLALTPTLTLALTPTLTLTLVSYLSETTVEEGRLWTAAEPLSSSSSGTPPMAVPISRSKREIACRVRG